MTARSQFIFDLIDEFQIFRPSGIPNEWSDADLNLFIEKYRGFSEQRDNELFQYITEKPNLFRCHLPYSRWTLSVAQTVVWYYDEIIVNDPILGVIKKSPPDPETLKRYLQEVLKYVQECKESITGGYILFAGDNLIPNRTGLFETESELILSDESVLNYFEKYSTFAKKPSPINSSPKDNLTQLMTIYEGMWGDKRLEGMHIPEHVSSSGKLNNSITYNFMSAYSRASKEEIIQMGRQSMLEDLRPEYQKDIKIVLETITNAQRLNTPVLFYRDLDCHVAKKYSLLNSDISEKQFVNTDVYNCTVPYLNGIPPERLFETRVNMPEAFSDFRYFLQELVSKAMKSTDNIDEVKYKVDKEIGTLLKKLQVEMKAAQRKMKVHAVAAPVAVCLGSLGLVSSGIDYSKLLAAFMGTGGAIRSLTTWSDVKSDKEKAALNPVYFLWKMQAMKK